MQFLLVNASPKPKIFSRPYRAETQHPPLRGPPIQILPRLAIPAFLLLRLAIPQRDPPAPPVRNK